MKTCTECERPMRHPSKTLAENPGTVAQGARGLCISDSQRIRRAEAKAAIDPEQAAQDAADEARRIDAARIALHGFINQRRRRGIPAEGIQEEEAA